MLVLYRISIVYKVRHNSTSAEINVQNKNRKNMFVLCKLFPKKISSLKCEKKCTCKFVFITSSFHNSDPRLIKYNNNICIYMK